MINNTYWFSHNLPAKHYSFIFLTVDWFVVILMSTKMRGGTQRFVNHNRYVLYKYRTFMSRSG